MPDKLPPFPATAEFAAQPLTGVVRQILETLAICPIVMAHEDQSDQIDLAIMLVAMSLDGLVDSSRSETHWTYTITAHGRAGLAAPKFQ